ncbi:hypothetical protein HZB01_04940 [Candidatus Woesearchaeota archaeon]|nr:hypothetical protein [Candidatus Woesearchaeota archaeon]
MGIGFLAMATGTGGAAAPVLLWGGKIMEGMSDGSAAANDCVINYEDVLTCGISGGAVLITGVNSQMIKGLIKKGMKGYDDLPASVREFIEKRLTKAAQYGDGKQMVHSMLKHDPRLVARGYNRVLGEETVTKIRVAELGTISEEGLAEGFANIGKLDDVGVELGSLDDASSWVSRLRKQNNVGFFAEAKRAAKLTENPYMEVKALDKKVSIPGYYKKPEYDIFVKNKVTGEGIIESVKNGDVNIDDAGKAIDDLIAIKNKPIDGIIITKTQFSLNDYKWRNWQRDRANNQRIDDLMTKIETNNIEIITFKEVK